MKKNMFIAAGFVSLLALVSCAQTHEHKFSDEWTTNDSMHWHDATCEHKELTKDLGYHDYDSDGFCKICGFETLEHYGKVTFNGVNCSMVHEDRYHLQDTITLLISPDNGYQLPATIEHSGLSRFQYDSVTGLIKGTVYDDIVLRVVCVKTTPPSYISEVKHENVHDTSRRKYQFDENTKTVIFIEEMSEPDSTPFYSKKVVYKYSEDLLHAIVETYRADGISASDLVEKSYRTYNNNYNLIEEKIYKIESEVEVFSESTCWTYDTQERLLSQINYSDETKSTVVTSRIYEYFDWGYTMTYWYNTEQLYETHEISYDFNTKTKTEIINRCTGGHREALTFASKSIVDLRIGKQIYYCNNNEESFNTYNGNGDALEYVRFSKKDEGYSNIPSDRVLFIYNEFGFLQSEQYQKYNETSGEFDNPWRTYNVQCNKDGYITGYNEYGTTQKNDDVTITNTTISGSWFPTELEHSRKPGNYCDILNWI